MARNTRGVAARTMVDVSADDARALVAKYSRNRRSCKVQKLGLQKVVGALVAQNARPNLIYTILTDKNGKFKAGIGVGPIQTHVTGRCVCFSGKDGPK